MLESKKLILSGKYEKAFIGKAISDGYSVPQGTQDDPSLEGTIEWNYETLYKHNKNKNKVLQMFLLFDQVTVLGAETLYDHSKLVDTGLVEVVTIDDNSELAGEVDLEDSDIKSYAKFIGDIVINHLAETRANSISRDRLKKFKLTAKNFYSCIYDTLFNDRKNVSLENEHKVLRYTEYMGNINYEKYKNTTLSIFHKNIESSTSHFATVHSRDILMALGELMTMLELSVKNNAILMQSDFCLENLESDYGTFVGNEVTNLLEGYQILRISLEESIGTLPHLKTIDDVLRLKEKKSRDIKRLRCVLSEITNDLRSGRGHALKRAQYEIKQATKELNFGTKVSKISKWATYLSLPIGVIESIYSLPPIMGLTTGAVGAATTLSPDLIKKKNNWIQVVR